MNKAGAIVRVSTVKQLDGTSPDKQLSAIQTFADEQEYYIEPANIWKLAESGNLTDREGFRSALNAATSCKVSRVYVFNVDRLGRNTLEMLLFLRVSIAAPCIPVIAALICTTKRSVEGVRILDLLGLQQMI